MFQIPHRVQVTHIARSILANAKELAPLTTAPRSERIRSLADAQRAYIDRVVELSGQTLTAIARAANVNPSTLTRFRNRDTHAGALSYLTIASIADATGVAAPSEILGDAPAVSTRQRQGFRETEAEVYQYDGDTPADRAIAAFIGNRPNIIPWELKGRSLEHEGYLPGDILLVDLNAQPVDGKIVCAQLYDWQNSSATQTVFRVFEAPFLLAGGPIAGSRKPRIVDHDNVVVKGQVIGMFRPV